MIEPLGRLGAAATLRQHCPQMTQRLGICLHLQDKKVIFWGDLDVDLDLSFLSDLFGRRI